LSRIQIPLRAKDRHRPKSDLSRENLREDVTTGRNSLGKERKFRAGEGSKKIETFKYSMYLLSLQVLLLTFKYSRHAREQMVARGISENGVEEGIQRGSKELQKPNKVLSFYRYFCVVYKKLGNDFYVITVNPR